MMHQLATEISLTSCVERHSNEQPRGQVIYQEQKGSVYLQKSKKDKMNKTVESWGA